MSIIRVAKRRRFTVLDNTAVEDDRLSFRALGLLVFLLSKPDDWSVNVNHLAGTHTEGREAVRTAVRELEAAGYVRRARVNNPVTGAIEWGCEVHETPIAQEPVDGSPSPRNPTTGEPTTGEPPLLKTDGPKTDEQREVAPDATLDEPTGLALRSSAPPTIESMISDVFAEWKLVTGHSRAVLDAKRKARIGKALRAYGLADTLDAVRGIVHSPWHNGQNENGTRYDDVSLILRDAEHIERFRDWERDPTIRPTIRKPAGSAAERRKQNSDDVLRRTLGGELQPMTMEQAVALAKQAPAVRNGGAGPRRPEVGHGQR